MATKYVPDNVFVPQFLQQTDFADGSRRYTLILCLKADLFQSNQAAISAWREITGLVNNTVCAYPVSKTRRAYALYIPSPTFSIF